MTDHSPNAGIDAGAFRRLNQILQTAHRVTPIDVGVWRTTPGPADSVVIAPADLEWLTNLVMIRVNPPAETWDDLTQKQQAEACATWNTPPEQPADPPTR